MLTSIRRCIEWKRFLIMCRSIDNICKAFPQKGNEIIFITVTSYHPNPNPKPQSFLQALHKAESFSLCPCPYISVEANLLPLLWNHIILKSRLPLRRQLFSMEMRNKYPWPGSLCPSRLLLQLPLCNYNKDRQQSALPRDTEPPRRGLLFTLPINLSGS